MAVPKHKTSKQRTHTRGSQWKLTAPTLVECKNCHQLVQLHRVCPNCGFYDTELKIDKIKVTTKKFTPYIHGVSFMCERLQ